MIIPYSNIPNFVIKFEYPKFLFIACIFILGLKLKLKKLIKYIDKVTIRLTPAIN